VTILLLVALAVTWLVSVAVLSLCERQAD